jgi:hypothetical protein
VDTVDDTSDNHACHVNQFGHPIGVDPEHFHLVAQCESDSRKWLKKSSALKFAQTPTQRFQLYRMVLNADESLSGWVTADSVQVRAIYGVAFLELFEAYIQSRITADAGGASVA